MNNYQFFANKDCEFYPCHELNEINCLFCFCPFYHDLNCGGNFTILTNGLKDCSACTYPHERNNYGQIIRRLRQ